MIGVLRLPRSPEKTITRSGPPGSSATRSRMIAEPRMCPASRYVAWIPGRDLLLDVVADRAEAAERLDGVVLRVERGVEVDPERVGDVLGRDGCVRGEGQPGPQRRRRPPRRVAPRSPPRTGRASADRTASVVAAAVRASGRWPRPPRCSPRSGRRPRPRRSPPRAAEVARVVGDGLLRVAALPAGFALGELLLEPAGVLSTRRASSIVPAVARIGPRKPSRTTSGMRPQWSRWAWVRRMASSSRGS